MGKMPLAYALMRISGVRTMLAWLSILLAVSSAAHKNAVTMTPPRAQRFRAKIGESTFDLTLDEDGVRIGERLVDAHIEPEGGDRYALMIGNRTYSVVFEPPVSRGGSTVLYLDGHRYSVDLQNAKDLLLERFGMTSNVTNGKQEVTAPMPGLVVRALVEPGDEVSEGQGLLVLEAMKMENELKAASSGTVDIVHVEAGTAVRKNDLLITFAER